MTTRTQVLVPARNRIGGDPFLIVAVTTIIGIGVASLHGVTQPTGGGISGDLVRQIASLVIGAIAFISASRVDYRLLRSTQLLLYLGGIAALLLVLVVGTQEFGARRWFVIGSYSLQPSEFGKLTTVVTVAAFASQRESRPRSFLIISLLFAVPTLLILVEPDLGSSLVLVAAWLTMMVAWRVPLRVLSGLATAVLAFIPLTFALAVPAYQRERLAVFLDPDRDPLGSGFTLRQVEVALGSGGVTGRGLSAAGSALEGLATRSSDFVLAQIGEQLGLAGTLAIVSAFAIIAWRGLAIAGSAADRFGQLLAVGITTLLVVPGILHIAVNVRLFPATGIPLPFVSLGGSALVVSCVGAGLLLSIANRQPPNPTERWTGARWE
jgi:rod shape determining protein RodA